ASALLFERLTILLRARGQLFSRGGGLSRASRRVFAFLSERSRALRWLRLLELRGLGARLQQRRLLLIFPRRGRKFARQRDAARAFLFERLTMLLGPRGQLVACGVGLQRDSGRFFAILLDRSRALRCLRLLDLGCFGACLQHRRLLLIFPLRGRKVARQCGAALAFFLERLPILLR